MTVTDKVADLKAQQVKQKEQEEQAALNLQKKQMQETLGEMLTPITNALAELQGKYQGLQESQIQAAKAPVKTPEQEMDEMIREVNDDDRYEKLSNKQLLGVISTSLDSALKANAQSVRDGVMEDMKPQMEKVGVLENTTLKIIAGLGVQAARSEHKDFDEHTKEIKQVLAKYPGMDYNDAYLLAKSQKAGAVRPNDQIESEKPQSTGAVPPGQPNPTAMTTENMEIIASRGRDAQGGQKLHGHVGFMALVEDAADKTLADRE